MNLGNKKEIKIQTNLFDDIPESQGPRSPQAAFEHKTKFSELVQMLRENENKGEKETKMRIDTTDSNDDENHRINQNDRNARLSVDSAMTPISVNFENNDNSKKIDEEIPSAASTYESVVSTDESSTVIVNGMGNENLALNDAILTVINLNNGDDNSIDNLILKDSKTPEITTIKTKIVDSTNVSTKQTDNIIEIIAPTKTPPAPITLKNFEIKKRLPSSALEKFEVKKQSKILSFHFALTSY